MPKFKVGDYVIGNAEASQNYGITRAGWVGVVSSESVGVGYFRALSVRDYEQSGLYNDDGRPRGYALDEDYFDLYVTPENNESDFEDLNKMFDDLVVEDDMV